MRWCALQNEKIGINYNYCVDKSSADPEVAIKARVSDLFSIEALEDEEHH